MRKSVIELDKHVVLDTLTYHNHTRVEALSRPRNEEELSSRFQFRLPLGSDELHAAFAVSRPLRGHCRVSDLRAGDALLGLMGQ